MPRLPVTSELIEAGLERAFEEGAIGGWRRVTDTADDRRRWLVALSDRTVSWSVGQVEAFLVGLYISQERGASK